MAKANLDSQSSSIALTTVVKDALIEHYGSLKAAAISMHMDQGQLTRELQTGDFKLKKLEGDEDAKATIAAALHAAFSQSDPRATARRELREIRHRIDRVEELIA